MQVNGLIIEELNLNGELKSFVLNRDYEIGDMWIAFPDEYDTERDGAFHFLSEAYAKHYKTVYDDVKMRKMGEQRFYPIGPDTFVFKVY